MRMETRKTQVYHNGEKRTLTEQVVHFENRPLFQKRGSYIISAVFPVALIGNPRRAKDVVHDKTLMEAMQEAQRRWKGATVSISAVPKVEV